MTSCLRCWICRQSTGPRTSRAGSRCSCVSTVRQRERGRRRGRDVFLGPLLSSCLVVDPRSGICRAVFPVPCFRSVSFVFWQAQAARLHGQYGPEGQLHWLLQGWYFWLQCTSRCVLFAGLQAHGARQSIFPTSLLYLAVTLLCLVLPLEYRIMEFPGDDSRNGFRTQHSFV